nr:MULTISPECIES: DUF427 domain-containing protein [unclassified Ornithinimicrobium]
MAHATSWWKRHPRPARERSARAARAAAVVDHLGVPMEGHCVLLHARGGRPRGVAVLLAPYLTPKRAAAQITGHVAFWKGVDIVE